MTKESSFGARLREARTQAGKTVKALAETVGVSVAYISDIERGHRNPPDAEKLVKIAECIGVKPATVRAWADEGVGIVRLPLADKKGKVIEAALLFSEAWDDMTLDMARDIIRTLKGKANSDDNEAVSA